MWLNRHGINKRLTYSCTNAKNKKGGWQCYKLYIYNVEMTIQLYVRQDCVEIGVASREARPLVLKLCRGNISNFSILGKVLIVCFDLHLYLSVTILRRDWFRGFHETPFSKAIHLPVSVRETQGELKSRAYSLHQETIILAYTEAGSGFTASSQLIVLRQRTWPIILRHAP